MTSKTQRTKKIKRKAYWSGWNDGLGEGLINRIHPNAIIKRLFWRIWYIKIRRD